MSETVTFDVSQIDDHAGHVSTIGDEIDKVHAQIDGEVGDLLMYGVVCGPVLWGALKLVVGSHATTIAKLAETLHATSGQLRITAQVYQDTEQTNTDASKTID